MNNNTSFELKEWYWLNLEGFVGKPFGQILEQITSRIVRIRFGVFQGRPIKDEIEIKLIDIKYIGKKLTGEDKVNIIPELL